MRKAATVTLFLCFMALQYGHMAAYMYCKWKAEVVLHEEDCGCEQVLQAVFEPHPSTDQLVPLSTALAVPEYVEGPEYPFDFQRSPINTIQQPLLATPIQEGFPLSLLRPPLI